MAILLVVRACVRGEGSGIGLHSATSCHAAGGCQSSAPRDQMMLVPWCIMHWFYWYILTCLSVFRPSSLCVRSLFLHSSAQDCTNTSSGRESLSMKPRNTVCACWYCFFAMQYGLPNVGRLSSLGTTYANIFNILPRSSPL